MGQNQKYRKIIFFKDYFQDFFDKQSKKVKAKIVWTFDLVEDLQRVPETYLKHLENTNGLYEIRVQTGNEIFRIFLFLRKRSVNCFGSRFSEKDAENTKERNRPSIKNKGRI